MNPMPWKSLLTVWFVYFPIAFLLSIGLGLLAAMLCKWVAA